MSNVAARKINQLLSQEEQCSIEELLLEADFGIVDTGKWNPRNNHSSRVCIREINTLGYFATTHRQETGTNPRHVSNFCPEFINSFG